MNVECDNHIEIRREARYAPKIHSDASDDDETHPLAGKRGEHVVIEERLGQVR